MSRLRVGPPLTLLIAAGCVLGTYLPGAAAFGIGGNIGSLLVPWTWLKLVTWPFVHADTAHLLSNMMLFLLLGPALEKQQGAVEFGFCLAITAVIIGLGQLAFGSG